MLPKTQQGFLVLADISGYTFFLANTELEHAHMAISFLLETIVEQLGTALTISKLEGDAVFAFCEKGNIPTQQRLMEVIDQTYTAFRNKAQTLKQGTTCTCKACVELPSLDLKFMVHHGEFIIQHVAGHKDLLGSDVNLVHRLLKNNVGKTTGWRGYALFTQQGLENCQSDKTHFIQQKEEYEHLGEVQTYIVDMHPRYKQQSKS